MSKINPDATIALQKSMLVYLSELHDNDLVDVINKDLLRRRVKAASCIDWSLRKYISKNNIDLSNLEHVKQLKEDLQNVDNFWLRFNHP